MGCPMFENSVAMSGRSETGDRGGVNKPPNSLENRSRALPGAPASEGVQNPIVEAERIGFCPLSRRKGGIEVKGE